MRKAKRGYAAPALEEVAGNGLLHRRALLGGGVAFAGALASGAASTGAAAEPLQEPEWSLEPGDVTPVLQKPSRFEAKRGAHAEQSRKAIRAPSMPGRRCRCSKARSRRTRCISPSCIPAFPTSIRRSTCWSSTAWSSSRSNSPSTRCCAIRWSRASISSNAAATARRCSRPSRSRRRCRRCTA